MFYVVPGPRLRCSAHGMFARRSRWINPGAQAVICIAAAIAALSAGRPVSADPPVSGYQLLWSSQFNGSSLNPLKWNFGQPWGSNVPPSSNSIGEPANVSVADNTLNLTAQNQPTDGYGYTTGLVNTSGLLNFTYGYVEADIQVPYTLGTWPAFWMLQNGWPPEIDVMEVPQQSYNNQPGSVGTAYDYYATYHYTGANGQPASAGTGMFYTGVNEATSLNDYGMLWTPNAITFYFNGNPVDTITGSQADIAQAKNMYLLLDLAVGGWPGNPPSWATFPTTMQIKNVNVWQLPSSSVMTMQWLDGVSSAQWNAASSWQNGLIPMLGSQTAVFGQTAASNTQVDWNNFITVGNLIFQNGSTSYQLGQTGTSGLMLADESGTATIEAETVNGGTAPIAINSELELYNNTDVINRQSAPLIINGDIYGLGQLNLQGGAVNIGGVVTNTGGINVDLGGTLNLTRGSIITPDDDLNLSTSPGNRAAMVTDAGTAVNVDVLRVGGYNGGQATFTENAGRVDTQTWFVIGQSGSAVGVADINGGTLSVRDGGGANGDLEVGVFNSASGTLNVTGNAHVQLLNGANLILGSQGTSGDATVNQTGGTVQFFADSGTTPGGGALILGRNGSTGVYTYNLDAGTLQVSQIESSSGTSDFIFNGGVLQATGNNLQFMTGLSHATIGPGGGTINTNGSTIQVSQSIGGTGALTVNGGGTLILTGNNPYVGGTTVTAATLVISNTTGSATGSGNLTVDAGGDLTGSGVVGGNVIINPGGALSPGAGANGGKLSIQGNLVLGSSSSINEYLYAIADGSISGSLISISSTGNLTVGSDIAVNLAQESKILPGIYQLIAYTGSLQGSDQLLSTWTVNGFDAPGLTYHFTSLYQPGVIDLVVNTASTPEPGGLLILSAAIALWPLYRRRWRRGA